MYPKKFEELVRCFTMLPGVGVKTAERYAFQTLKWNDEMILEWVKAFEGIEGGIPHCNICGNISDEETCEICKDTSRDQNTILVVESPKDVVAFERLQEYKGVYHVLGGVIATTKGVYPEDIHIDELIERVTPDIHEIVLALNPTVEGDTTALYIQKRLEHKDVRITRLASGIPIGGHLDYADERTLIKAFEGRK